MADHKGRGRQEGERPRSQIRKKMDELVRDTGLPESQALLVARGHITLNEAIQRIADLERVERLVRRHELNRSLATQVVKGDVSLDDVLQRKRQKAHLKRYADRSILERAIADKSGWIFGLHGQRLVRAQVKGSDLYEVTLEADGADGAPAGPLGTVHKLQLKFVATTDDADAVRSVISLDPETSGAREPITQPQDRYRCSDKRLFSWLDAKAVVMLTTLEGDQVKGTISWIGRWEVGLVVGGDWELIVFRHAIANISGGRWDSEKAD